MRLPRPFSLVVLLAGFLSALDMSPLPAMPARDNCSGARTMNSAARHYFTETAMAAETSQNQPGGWRHFGSDDSPATARPRPRAGSGRLVDLEQQMLALVNQDRRDPSNRAETQGGRAQPLRWNERLAEVARAHSRNMMERRFFNHVDPQGRTPAMRIKSAGIPWRALGENIATNGGGVRVAEAAFMNEPRFRENHRANILNPKFTDVGIGIVQDSRGRYYITQDFITAPATH